ncbi:MHYT domain-containing protein [Streptomyces sp. NPDC059017]|uniref:MHYT domain-containing protein n=1 Tax=Streptomyces sp. NPDC059017 TaxID=3346700 RepID=UPI0036C7AB00
MNGMHHFQTGWLAPVIAYVTACLGAAMGLRCTARSLVATGRSRLNWLLIAAACIGSGIWTMHFIGMLGCSVPSSEIRYDVPLTLVSLLVAMVVVGLGLLVVAYGRFRTRSVLLAGPCTGLGVAAMHYLGMAALQLHGEIVYDLLLVAASVLIAVVAATAALWAAVMIKGSWGTLVASLVMGLTIASMHYTAMTAAQVHPTPVRTVLPGASPIEFIFPIIVAVGSFLFVTCGFVALSPTVQEMEEPVSAAMSYGASVPSE